MEAAKGYRLYKQAGIWIVLAILAAVGSRGFLMGQTAPKKAAEPKAAATKTTDAQNGTPATGRYQIIFNPNVRADTFLLDTQTGKTWVHTTISDVKGRPTIWISEDRLDSDQAFVDWTRQQVLLPSTPPASAPVTPPVNAPASK